MEVSSGIILYRERENTNDLEFFVAHAGGPYWRNRDTWTFPKGKVELKDKSIQVEMLDIPFLATSTWMLHDSKILSNKDKHNEFILLNTAIREFYEETGILIESPIKTSRQNLVNCLGKVKQNAKKWVYAFSFPCDFEININKCKSITTTMEYPPKSGNFIEFPENDKFAWFTFGELENRTHPKHIDFYKQIIEQYNGKNN